MTETAFPIGGLDSLTGDESGDDNNITKLLRSLIEPMQQVEDVGQAMKSERGVDTAVGAQLNLLGKIVGQPRNGLSDDDYRRYIRARIFTNRSDGTTEDLIRVTILVLNDSTATINVSREGTATVVVRAQDAAVSNDVATIIIAFLREAASAGVRVLFEYGTSAPAGWFRFDSGPGWDQGHLAGALE